MEHLTIDVGRITRELEQLTAAEAEVDMRLREMQAQLDDMRRRRERLEGFMAEARLFAVESQNESVTTTLGPGPLSNMTGPQAVQAYGWMHPGEVVKVEHAYGDMRRQGFPGTLNAVSVAFATLAKQGRIKREKRGHYRFPEETETTGHLSLTVQRQDQEGIGDA